MGYRGSYGRVSAYLREKRTSPRPVTAQPPAPRVVTRWILSRPETLTEIEQLRLKTVLANSPGLDALTGHVRSFAQMLTERQGECSAAPASPSSASASCLRSGRFPVLPTAEIMVGMNSRSEQDTTDDSDVPQPNWTEEIDLQTADAAGLVRHVTICLSDPFTALIALLDAHSRMEFSGTDYLDCLSQVRQHLERDGRLLCCQGARPNVHPSGQQGRVLARHANG